MNSRPPALAPLTLLFAAWFSLGILIFAHEGEDHGEKSDAPKPALMLTNEMCPVMTENKVDPEVFVEYAGKRIYLCCAKCKKQFLKAPELYLANLPQFSKTATDDTATTGTGTAVNSPHTDISDSGHEHAEHERPGGGEGMEERHDDNIGHKHDHAADHGQPGGIGRMIRFAGKFHPVMVHFPIALILTAALAETLGMLLKKAVFLDSAFFLLLLGAASAVVTASSGWPAGAFAHYPGMEWVLSLHRWLGSATAATALATAVCAVRARKLKTAGSVKTYRLALGLAAALVGVTSHFGAALIYGLNHFTF